jgi:hypothetical protein
MTYKEETINGYVKQLWQYLFNSDQLPNSIYSINGFSYLSISVYLKWKFAINRS